MRNASSDLVPRSRMRDLTQALVRREDVGHLRDRHINVQRHASCADLPFTWVGKKSSATEPIVEKPVVKKVAKKVATKVAKQAVDKMDSAETWMERVLKDFQEHPKARPK